MMGDKIGALSERGTYFRMDDLTDGMQLCVMFRHLSFHTFAAGAMSMFKTLQLKAIIYELHLCLYKDENSCHKIVPLLGAEFNFDTKKDTRFSIITAKNKIYEVRIHTYTSEKSNIT